MAYNWDIIWYTIPLRTYIFISSWWGLMYFLTMGTHIFPHDKELMYIRMNGNSCISSSWKIYVFLCDGELIYFLMMGNSCIYTWLGTHFLIIGNLCISSWWRSHVFLHDEELMLFPHDGEVLNFLKNADIIVPKITATLSHIYKMSALFQYINICNI